MKKTLLGVVLAGGLLAGCTDDQVTQVQTITKAACGVVPAAADVATVLAAAGSPSGQAVQVALTLGAQICQQYLASQKVMTLVPNACIATINGICIHKES